MNAIKGIYKNGQVVLETPTGWPEGTEVMVEPVVQEESWGMREEDWSDTPEAIAEWLAWYDSLEPLVFTPAEEAAIAEWRQKVKEYTLAHMHKDIEGIFP